MPFGRSHDGAGGVTGRYDSDLLVVGGGTAGMACAIVAAEAGAEVVVVEKTGDVGGTLHLSSGQLSAAGARRQRERGIDDDSPDRHFEDVMRLSRGTADPVIVRKAVEEAAATIDWLDDLGFEFAPEAPAIYYGHEPYSMPRTYWGPEGGRSILRVMRPLFDRQVAAGRIRPLFEHRAAALIQEGGHVVGVRAEAPAGHVELRAPFTVLTTGGYGANRSFFEQHTPQAAHLISACRPSSTGDGIAMALDVGARLRGTEYYLPTVGGFEPEPGSGSAGAPPQFAVLNAAVWPARAIHVNEQGERFFPEDDRSPDRRERALLGQPGQRVWVVFDDASLADGLSFHSGLTADRVRQLSDCSRVGFKGRDLASLAHRAGLVPEGLERTVAEWNAAVASGHDPLGVRDPGPPIATPPFYAFLVHGVVVATFGGLAVDRDLHVLDGEGRPIPGLFAAGEALGISATSGDSFCGGMLATPALSFGRILGRELALAARAEAASVAG
jgi:fumarate reductase flavoprotein subunit